VNTPGVNTNRASAKQLTLQVDDTHSVCALSLVPPDCRAMYLFAHGAGAGMTHASMEGMAQALYDAGIATFRFQFPYMQRGSRRPDPPALCHRAIRAAAETAASIGSGLPLIAGGRSFGGRMTSQAQATQPIPGVIGLVFLGFPLHAAGKPGDERAAHLSSVRIPMLFLQGDHDELAHLDLLRPVVAELGRRATLTLIAHADHSFKLPARAGRSATDVNAELARVIRAWLVPLIAAS